MTITRVNLYENLNERDIKKDARRREFDNFTIRNVRQW